MSILHAATTLFLATLAYILFYTAYSKVNKRLEVGLLLDVFALRKGWNHTLVELNKAISLSGLTCVLLSFLPQLESQQRELLFISMNTLWVHSVYSTYNFYKFDVKNYLKEVWVRQLSLAFGSAGQIALLLGYYGFVSYAALVGSATSLGIAHFYLYEIDFKGVLQVRPFAYLPFPLAALALYYLASTYNNMDSTTTVTSVVVALISVSGTAAAHIFPYRAETKAALAPPAAAAPVAATAEK